jgi:hypothetical protein
MGEDDGYDVFSSTDIPFILCEVRNATTNTCILSRHILEELATNTQKS